MDTLKELIGKTTRELDSSDPSVVITGLNTLTSKSQEPDSGGIYLENYNELSVALSSLLDVVNPLGCFYFMEEDSLEESDKTSSSSAEQDHDVVDSDGDDDGSVEKDSWNQSLPSANDAEFKLFASSMDENVVLLTILNIMRNLTMDVSNESHVALSPVFMRHCVTVLLANLETNYEGAIEASTLVFDMLLNIAYKIDFSGRRRQEHSFFLDSLLDLDDKQKAYLQQKMQSSASAGAYKLYHSTVMSLLPIIYRYISTTHLLGRPGLLKALELLAKLSSVSENASVFSQTIPQSMLTMLVQLLCVSLTQAEPLVSPALYGNSGDVLGVTRPPVAMLGPAFSFLLDSNDTEIRVAAIDCLHALCHSSTILLSAVANTPGSVEILTRVVTASDPNNYTGHADGHVKASLMLTQMFAQPSLYARFMSVRTELVLAACTNDYVAEMLCSSKQGGTAFLNLSVPAAAIAARAEEEAAAAALALDGSGAIVY